MEQLTNTTHTYTISENTEIAIKKATLWAHRCAVISIVGIVVSLLSNVFLYYNDGVTLVAKMIGVIIGSALSICFAVFLYFFSKHTNQGIDNHNPNLLTRGIYNLKLYFNVMGVLVIIFLSFFVLIIILGILIGIAKS